MSVLVCERASFAYAGGPAVLRDVSMRAGPGVTGLIGVNGSGKSTLLRLLGGLARPRRGEVLLVEAADQDPPRRGGAAGRAVAAMRPRERAGRMALVAQRPSVSGAFTVTQVVRLGRYAQKQDDSACERAVERVGLTELHEARFDELSVGQQQRVSIARALAQLGAPAPSLAGKLLLADEPTAALDPAQVQMCCGLLRELAGAGATVVIATHDLLLAQRTCDQVVALSERGELAFAGPPGQVMTTSAMGALFRASFARIDRGGDPGLTLPID